MTAEFDYRSISGLAAIDQPVRHVYVHVPFCARICPYCAFYKELTDRSQTERFCHALLAELEQHLGHFEIVPHTIFFGGGTPTALTNRHLKILFDGFPRVLDLSELEEWTLEANPGSVSPGKAALLLEAGVDRISLGVQAWDDKLLKILGREHNARQAAESFRILRQAGFRNINIDLMFGLPGQNIAQWKDTLRRTIDLRPEHVSAYCLTYEEDTEFFRRHARGQYRSDPDLEAHLFELAMSQFENAGYEQYEISNYALPGYASIHNRGYWAGHDYVGIGPSAFSTRHMRRWQNVCDYREYSERVLNGRSAVGSEEMLNDNMKRTERIALSLRTKEGISINSLGPDQSQAQELIDLGLVQAANGNFILTRRGRAMADSVAEALL